MCGTLVRPKTQAVRCTNHKFVRITIFRSMKVPFSKRVQLQIIKGEAAARSLRLRNPSSNLKLMFFILNFILKEIYIRYSRRSITVVIISDRDFFSGALRAHRKKYNHRIGRSYRTAKEFLLPLFFFSTLKEVPSSPVTRITPCRAYKIRTL